jgi:capsular exopolysaccharide synthesis family protein
MLQSVVARYEADRNEKLSEEHLNEVISAVIQADVSLQRRSRIVRIAVRSTDPVMAADNANAYAAAAETFAQEENKAESENAVAWLKATVDAQRHLVERTDQEILNFRVANKIDILENERTAVSRAYEKSNADVLDLESKIMDASELVKKIESVQDDPNRFGALPESIPRAQEIAQAYQKLLTTVAERDALLAKFTSKHPDVQVQEKIVDVYKNQFTELMGRTRETAAANLDMLERRLGPLKQRRAELEKRFGELQNTIDASNARLGQLQREQEVNDFNYKALLNRMEEARIASDENTATIKMVENCSPPQRPVSPNPMIIFPAGPILGLMLGILFVLVVDHLEDKITSIFDAEQRLRSKVLCVLPHIPRKRREEIALLAVEDKFSQFTESLAGLRNLLSTPSYRHASQVLLVISTQPSEGKTISSCNLALSYASSGQKTLLVDFDMRRPRLARIFLKKTKAYESLPHTLAKRDKDIFKSLPVDSGYANLDVVLSRPASDISPASLMGTGMVDAFFTWARQNYERIIIDSPPFGVVGDAVVLASLCDSVMLLCCPGRSRFRPLKHALRHLSEAGANVIGVLINDVHFGKFSAFSGYDYHYRHAYQYSGHYAAHASVAQANAVRSGVSQNSKNVTSNEDNMPNSDKKSRAVNDAIDVDDDDL